MRSVDHRVEEILDRIRQRGGRVTAPRRLIVAAMLRADEHLTAERLAAIVQEEHPEVHLSTVYRCLETLAELGVVTHVHLGHGPAVYHLAAHDHTHAVCESCGQVTEVPDDLLEEVRARLAAATGFTLDGRHFALVGQCRRCTAA